MKNLLILLFLISYLPLYSQLEINLDIVFEASIGQGYVPLENYTKLTEGLGAWDDFFYEEIELSYPIIIPGFEDRPMNLLEIDAYSLSYFLYENWSDDTYSLDLFMAPIDEIAILSPLNDSNNDDQGDILFYESEELIIIEYRNIAFAEEFGLEDGNLVSRANFQIEIDKVGLCFQFKYGPSTLSQGMQDFFSQGMLVGLGFGWFFEDYDGVILIEDYEDLFGLISGDPNEPDFNLVLQSMGNPFEGIIPILESYPEEGTVYQFCFDDLSSTEVFHKNKNSWQIYPNPVSDYLHVSFPESYESGGNNYQIQLMDVYGKLVLEQSIADNQNISVKTLPSGIYFAQLKAQNSFEIQRIVISR